MNNSKPPIEEQKFVCPHCGADWADATMIGDPEYNDMWECDKCGQEYGSARMITPSNKEEKCQHEIESNMCEPYCRKCKISLPSTPNQTKEGWEEVVDKLWAKDDEPRLRDFIIPYIHSTILPQERKRAREEEHQFFLNILDGIDKSDKQMGVEGGTKAIRHALKSRYIGE